MILGALLVLLFIGFWRELAKMRFDELNEGMKWSEISQWTDKQTNEQRMNGLLVNYQITQMEKFVLGGGAHVENPLGFDEGISTVTQWWVFPKWWAMGGTPGSSK